MREIIFRNTSSSVKVSVKVDIMSVSDATLSEPSFETRFTNMTFEGYDDAAKALFNIQEIENSWQQAIALAENTTGIGMYFIGASGEVEVVAP